MGRHAGKAASLRGQWQQLMATSNNFDFCYERSLRREGVNPPYLKGFALTATSFAYPKSVNTDAQDIGGAGFSLDFSILLASETLPSIGKSSFSRRNQLLEVAS
ncbi:MAG: hypothetical protein JW942_09460 [Opitutales bacterium]|nr:hypothetical protein [Opitutales bacterium]